MFKFLFLPLGTVVLGVWIKFTSRNDQYAKFRKEDIAVGLDLILTACLMYVVLTTERAIRLTEVSKQIVAQMEKEPVNQARVIELQQVSQSLSQDILSSGWLIALSFIGLFSLSAVVRKWGWNSETEMKSFIGITIPLLFGIIALLGVMAGAT